ncbi:MAG: hypothetical protein U9R19_00550 [Bacteroidota bacterium]|nr:hypothetical protein [Bacteroidota bacterium]
MENLSFAEQKISLAQTILSLTDKNSFTQIQSYINSLYKGKRKSIKKQEDDFDAKTLTFDEWNKQFEDEYDLDDYIPEYGMSLHDFRLRIYKSEKETGITKQEFVAKMDSLK